MSTRTYERLVENLLTPTEGARLRQAADAAGMTLAEVLAIAITAGIGQTVAYCQRLTAAQQLVVERQQVQQRLRRRKGCSPGRPSRAQAR